MLILFVFCFSSTGLDMAGLALALQDYQAVLVATNGSSLLDMSSLSDAVALFAQSSASSSSAASLLVERQLLADVGLPERPFYRHLVQAPGKRCLSSFSLSNVQVLF